MNASRSIALSDVKFAWPQQPLTLDIPEWHVDRGARILLRGASGSGKSTLLSLLSGVQTPQQGSVVVEGQNLTQLSSHQRDIVRANHMGYIFQQFNLLPYLTAFDNVVLIARFSKARRQQLQGKAHAQAQQLLSRLGLTAAQQQSPAGNLSVGQQQRVAVARALLGNPPLIIADEPTSALDTQRRDAFLDVLLEMASEHNTTVLFVSHDPSLATHFDQHVELAQINQVATTEELAK
ncbi:methionine ABC transporter ATP-binding protein [Idiomarina tyrosinivorans]|uniref:Methionine ABC transporter ATP-binding protein n=1 Tax=Idiomarina tyrosinivorans TaxID=1445662 RepID=A0A432ZS45_9GAMM|nr:ABC transporter ATP-binding protein [Idiomarina tyrosinivorans]RUO80656.1 methionine ABC transporter ATP-binding protein [Idiomarina tyrosinivorans]